MGWFVILQIFSSWVKLICGVLAGVGARSPAGDWRWTNGRLSKESLEISASSSTFCKRVFTCPLNKASPEPGVIIFGRQLRCLVTDEIGVIKLPAANPTIGESLVISISADRSCPFTPPKSWDFRFLCRDFDKPLLSHSSTFPENNPTIEE